MDIQATIEKNKNNIWQAINDYGAHTNQTYVLDDVSEKFVDRLARDNAYSKRELRNLFRKSPVWNEKLDALVIMFSLPTASLKELGRYLMRLLSKGVRSNEVVTRFSLVKATNKGGIVYAKASFKMDRKLTNEEMPLIMNLSEQIKRLSGQVGFEDVDVEPAVLSKVDNELPLNQSA